MGSKMLFQELSRLPVSVLMKNINEKTAAMPVQKIAAIPNNCIACDMALGVRTKMFKPKTASHVPIKMPMFWAFSVAMSLLLMVVSLRGG